MSKSPSVASARIRAEVTRLVGMIPPGKFTTYGSIAIHMNVTARQVANVMSGLTEEESARLPWQRVVSADARISRNMNPELALLQRQKLESEGTVVGRNGKILDDESHFHVVGIRRDIRWGDNPPPNG